MAGTSNSITTHNVLNGVLNADNVISGLVNTAFNPAYALVTQAGAQIVLFINSSDYKMYAQLKDKSGNLIYTSNIIDLPLETMVVDGRYDSGTKKLILVLDNGNEIEVPLGALISGLVNENDLVANYYDKDEINALLDGYWTKIELTQEDIDNWNAKQEYLNQGDGIEISADTILKGNIYQESTTGKNLLKNTNVNSGDNNYWNSYSIYDEETGTLTRSTTSTTESFISHRINLKNNTKYTISCLAKSNGYVRSLDIYVYNSTTTKIYSKADISLTTNFQKYSFTFTTDSTDFTNSAIRFDNNGSTQSGTEATLTIKDVMLVEGEDTEFEPYTGGIPAPNPDYPQDIHVVSGDNSINVCGKNLFKPTFQNNGTNIILNNISTYSISNGEFSFTASGTDMYFGNVKNAGSEYSDERGIKIFRNDNDYISFNLSNTSLNRTYITAYDSNNISLGFTNINSYRGAYQFPSGCDYITFRFGKADATSGTTYKTTIMVAYGNTIPTYEHYIGNTYPINLPVENYLPNNATTQTINGITYTINEDKSIKINGTASGRADIYLYGSNTDTGSYTYIPKGTYTMDTSNLLDGTMFLQFREKTAGVVYQTKQNNGLLTLLSQQDCYFYGIMLAVENGKTINNLTFYPQIEKGTKLNSYTPYGTTPIELCKIGDYQDYFYKDNGSWYLHKEIGKVVLNGSEDIGRNEAQNGTYRYTVGINTSNIIKINDSTTISPILSNKLIATSRAGTFSQIQGICYGMESTTSYKDFIIYCEETKNMTGAEFITWLSNNNVTVYYILATPTNTEITDSTLLSQLNALTTGFSNNWVENVSQTNADLPFEIEYDNKNLTISASSNLVRNTDYATSNTGGVIKIGYYNFNISEGRPYVTTTSYADYQNLGNGAFVGKGTLDNVLNAKIGNIQTLLDNLNNGNGVE